MYNLKGREKRFESKLSDFIHHASLTISNSFLCINRKVILHFLWSFFSAFCFPSISHLFPKWRKDKVAKDMLFKVSEYLYLKLQPYLEVEHCSPPCLKSHYSSFHHHELIRPLFKMYGQRIPCILFPFGLHSNYVYEIYPWC